MLQKEIIIDETKLKPIQEFRMYPIDIEFGQDSIKTEFADGRDVHDLMADLICAQISVDDIPPLMIKKCDGKWFCMEGNRRLFVLKKLDQYNMCDPVRCMLYQGDKGRSYREGRPLKIRGDPEFEERINGFFDMVHDLVFPGIPKMNMRLLF